MKIKIIYVMAVALCVGCETLMEIGSPSVCSHENMTVYRSNVFPDGQHYLFKGGKLAGLANVKDGYAEGKFEIYYPTGIFKYKGSLDNRGHVISGKYNEYSSSESEYGIRKMTTADMQNAWLELIDIIKHNESRCQQKFIEAKTVEEKKECSLFDCTNPEFHPIIDMVYRHDGSKLKVFQALNDGAMVSSELFMLDIVVETPKGYVDGEMLRPGKYKYIGPHTYETIEKKKRTIRHFQEIIE